MSESQPADWPDPLTVPELIEKLRAMAEVAEGDSHHDFGTVFDTFGGNARLAGKAPLSLAECQQILRAVRASIPGAGAWRSDLMVLNRHLFDECDGLTEDAARQVLPRLFRTAAGSLATSRPDSPAEGGIDHV